MANEIGSFIVNIQAKVEGYLAEIDKIKKALSEVGANTSIGKDLGKLLAAVEKLVDSLARKMTLRISSESLITRLKDNLDGIDLAFGKIGTTMLKVKLSDLNFDQLNSSTKQLINDLKTAQEALDKTFNESFRLATSGSKELLNAYKLLNIDPEKMSAEKIGTKLANGLETALKALQKTSAELDNLKTKLQELLQSLGNLKANPLNNDKLTSKDLFGLFFDTAKAQKASMDISNWITEIKTKFSNITSNMKDGTLKETALKLIDSLIGSDTPELIKAKITLIVLVIQEGSKNLNAVRNEFKIGNKTAHADNIVESIFGSFDFSKFNIENLKGLLTEFLSSFGDLNLSVKDKDKLLEAAMGITEKDLDAAIKKITDKITSYRAWFKNEAKTTENELAKTTTAIQDATTKLSELQTRVNTLESGANTYQKEIESLNAQLKAQKEQIEKLLDQINKLLNNPAEGVLKAGAGVSEHSAEGLNENARAAQLYALQLEHVKDAEKMVGKIEGIAQRWFSIYAAVRMVTNAIRSMKATIEDLDKTITEIAIVTNMSQSDLWGLMGKYTQLAREYAASIKGVYEVSLLYYQQGLQTADVMALTELTLKMARISGLSYKDATDYMTNAVRSFKMEMTDALRVVDVYSAIAASSATNVTELAEAMSKTASSAEAVGSSFENTTAMMAVMIEATREAPLNIGSALKSIISRYGEMKADPAKLVDSEGEELSFNKVDTALLSVGISIKNAEGLFRNFDDVIKELAASWDTIDVNTQRYIATIMAGNRQQSRFLALVSNYDRYEELSTKAADAENASQLLFLKTLDSVQAKTQLLLTSLLSLYTGSGIQDLYKGILDVSNAIIQSFTSMPTLFNLPIAAVLKFGATFWSLASVVKSVFGLIINQLAIEKTKANMLINGEIAVVRNAENLKVQATAESYSKMNAIIAQKLKDRERLTQEEADFYAKLQLAKTNSLRSTGTGQLGSFSLPGGKTIGVTTLGLNTGALLANLAGTALKSLTNGIAQGAGGILSIAGSAMSGAAMGSFIPGGAAVGAVLGALVGAFSNLNNILPNTAKQLENLTKIAEERKNKALQEQAEAKSLLSSIDKLKELEKTRYSSIEAEQAYLEASDTLALLYPELIQKYDETGKAIIDLAAANDLLLVSLLKSADAVRDAAIANYNRVKAEKESNPFFTSTAGKTSTLLLNLLQSDNLNVRTKVATADLTGIHGSSDIIKNINNEFLKTIANSFLAENISTKEVYEGLTTSIDAAKKLEGLNEFDLAVLDAIDLNLSSYTKEITRAISNDNKLSAAGESGARTYINSLLLMTAYLDKFFNDISDSNNILATILINQFKDYNGDYEKYMQDIPNNLEKALEKLKDAIETISPKEFNKLIDLRKTTSAQGIATYINNNFKDLDAEITLALLDYFNNIYNIEDFKANISNFDNSGVRLLLINFSDYFNNLTDTELLAINNYAELIQKELSSGSLTNVLAGKKLTAYLSIWKLLESSSSELSEEQINTAESLLQSWDGTKEGLEAIQASIPSTNATKPLLTFIDELLKRIPENLNTSLQTLTSSITSKTKDFKDISLLSKGVELDKAIKYAEELDLSFNDLELDYSTGLFKLKDLNKGYGHFFDKIDKLIDDLIGLTQKFTNTDVLSNLQTLANMTVALRNENDNSLYYDKISAIYNDLDKNAVDEILTAYDAAKEAAKAAGDVAPQLSDFIALHYTEEATFLQAVIKDVKIRAELNVGRISEAIKLITGLTDENSINNIISSLTKNNGKINEQDLIEAGLSEETINALKNYGLVLSETFDSATEKVYDKAIESITKGKLDIDVNEFNKDLLKSLGAEIDKKTKKATINWQGLTVGSDEYNKKIAIILEKGITKEEEEILKSLEEAINGRSAVEVADSVINSWDKVSSTAALLFKSTFNLKDDDFAKAFTWDPIAKVYRSNLDKIREIIRDGSQLSEKDLNKALADIDKAIRESSGISIFNDIAKNYNLLTEESILKLADGLHKSYNEIKDALIPNGDGTYKVDLALLLKWQNDLKATADKSAKETIASIIDGYISQLSGISQILGQGYTNLADMQKLANEIGESTGNIFSWNEDLKAFTLNQYGIAAQAKHAHELLALIKDQKTFELAFQLVEANAELLAGLIDFDTLISSMNDGTFEKLKEKFLDSISNYNQFIHEFGAKSFLDPALLLELIEKGGREALIAGQKIAAAQGRDLNSTEVETLYRSGMEKINTALDLMQLSVGSIIDDTTAALLGIENNVSSLGGGKSVINKTFDMVEAYEKLLAAMEDSSTATLAELNALKAKIDTEIAGGTLIESLSNINNMTYETLAKIASDANLDYDKLKESLIQGGALEDLGFGHIRITDFDFFASLIGITNKASDTYIEMFSAANDAFIDSLKKKTDNIINLIKSIADAKPGEDINVAYLRLNELIDKGIIDKLESLHAYYHDGLLTLDYNAKVGEVIQLLANSAKDISGLTERDMAEILDAIDAFLKSIAENITNGIKGTLSNTGRMDLTEQMASYRILLTDKDFAKTADGWKLTRDAAIEVWDTIRKIDDILGNIVFAELKLSLIETDERFLSVTASARYAKDIDRLIASKKDALNNGIKSYAAARERNNGSGAGEYATRQTNGEITYTEVPKNEFSARNLKNFLGTPQSMEVPFVVHVDPKLPSGEKLDDATLSKYVEDLISKSNGQSEKLLELNEQGYKLNIEVSEIDDSAENYDASLASAAEHALLLCDAHAAADNTLQSLIAKLEREKDLIDEMAMSRATSKDDSFAFMNNKMPAAMENPLTYAENWGKALDILLNGSGKNKKGKKAGFIDAQDFYNIVNEMNHLADIGLDINLFGHKLDGELQSASDLIEHGFSCLESVGDGKMLVNISKLLSEFGTSLEAGALSMEDGVTAGIHAIAESNIKMLDGLIAVLETVVAMLEAFEGIDVDLDNLLDFGELFDTVFAPFEGGDIPTGKFKANEKFVNAANKMLTKFAGWEEKLNSPLQLIKINGEKLGTLFQEAAKGTEFSKSLADALTAAMNALYQASLSNNYDLNNIYDSVKEILLLSGLVDGSVSIDVGNTTLYLTGNVITEVDWGSDKVKKSIKDYFTNKKGKKGEKGLTAEELAREAWNTFAKEPLKLLSSGDTNSIKFILETSSEVTIDEKTGEYIIDDAKFKTPEAAYKALMLKKISKKAKITEVDGLPVATIKGKEGATLTVTITDDGKELYVYTGPDGNSATGDSAEAAIKQYWTDRQATDGTINIEEKSKKTHVELGLSSYTKVKLKEENGEPVVPTVKLSRDATQLLNNPAIQTWRQLKSEAEKLDLPITIDADLDSELTVADLLEVGKLFSTDYKMEAKNVALTVNTDDILSPLKELLTNQTPTTVPELKVKLTTDGADLTNTEGTKGGSKPLEISAPVTINPTSLTIGAQGNTGEGATGEGTTNPKMPGITYANGDVKVIPTTITIDSTVTNTIPEMPGETNAKGAVKVTASNISGVDFSQVIGEGGKLNVEKTIAIMALIGILSLKGTPPTTDTSGITNAESEGKVDVEALTGALTVTGSSDNPDISGVSAVKTEDTIDVGAAVGSLLLWYATGKTTPDLLTGGLIQLTDELVDAASNLAELVLSYVAGTTKPTVEGLPAEGVDSGATLTALATIGNILISGGIGDGEGNGNGPFALRDSLKALVATAVGTIATAENMTPEAKYTAYALIGEILAKPTDTATASNLIKDVVTLLGLADIILPTVTITLPYVVKPKEEGEEPTIDSDLRDKVAKLLSEGAGPLRASTQTGDNPYGGKLYLINESNNKDLVDYIANLKEVKAAGGDIPQADINNLNEMASALGNVAEVRFEDGSTLLLGEIIGYISQAKTEANQETTQNITSLQEAFAAFAAIEPTGIQSCVSALEELITKLNVLKDYDWASVLLKLSQLFSGNSGEDGKNSSLGATGNLGVTVNATYSDTYIQELMANQNITRTITVNIVKGTDETDGGPKDETVDKTDNTGGKTTVNNEVTNLELNATASLDTGDLDSKLQTLSNAMGTLGSAISEIPTNKHEPVDKLAGAMDKIPDGKDDIVKDLASAMKDIPAGKDLNIKALTKAINDIPKVNTIAINAAVRVTFSGLLKDVDVKVNISEAKGNVPDFGKAKAKGDTRTLVGELGPELYVSNGRYYMVGEHGAEFVDLPRDSIIFNHVQTRQLLEKGATGRGKPFTNVSNAISYAKGTLLGNARQAGGPGPDLIKKPKVTLANPGEQNIGKIVLERMEPWAGGIGFPLAPSAFANHKIFIGPSGTTHFAWAKGTPLGYANASASAALAALKQLRAMWESMLGASAKDLGALAGRGGGGSKPSKEKDENGKERPGGSVIEDIQRWYNLVRKIENCEQKITYWESMQNKYEADRIANGEKIYEALKKLLDRLKEEVGYQQRLVKLLKSWYDAKVDELAKSSYGKIFTYIKSDQENAGLMQYVKDAKGTPGDKPGSGFGLDILENLTRRSVAGKPMDNAVDAKSQLKYLAGLGFKLNDLIWNDDGSQVVKSITQDLKLSKFAEDKETDDDELYKQLMENFWNSVDGWMEELDSLWNSVADTENKIEENQTKLYEIIQKFVDNELEVENKLLEAIEAREQAVIDKLNEQKTVLEKSTLSFVNGLKEQLDREKDIQSKNDEQEALTKLQRLLAILQRSGGSASQIKSLQDLIASKQQDMYYNGRQDEIDTILKAADKQLERLDKLIEILTETLEYLKKNGLFWDEIHEIMDKSEEYATSFYNEWVVGKSGNSILLLGEDIREFKELFLQWVGYRTDKLNKAAQLAAAELAAAEEAAWQNKIDTVISQDSRFKELNESILGGMNSTDRQTASDRASNEAKKAYETAIQANPEDEDAANAAASEAYNKSLLDSKAAFVKRDKTNQFNANYEQWKKNRLLADANDFITTKTFKNNEAKFRNSMLLAYLASDIPNDDAGLKKVWHDLINQAEKNINAAATENTLQSTFSKKAKMYTYKNLNGKGNENATPIKNGKGELKTIDKGKKKTFDDANVLYIPDGSKRKKANMLRIKDTDTWVKAADVKNGSSIFSRLSAGTLSTEVHGVGGNKYTTPSTLDKTWKFGGLTLSDIGKKELTLTSGKKKKVAAKNNTVRIIDITGLKVNKKGQLSSFSKIKIDLLNGSAIKPVWIKSNSGLKGKLQKKYYNSGGVRSILDYLNAYAEGGMADFTGPAWLDGTKKRPEAVLNPDQTKFLREDLLGRQENSLMSIVLRLQKDYSGTLETNAGENIIFENIDVTFEAGTISNDYDMRRASEMFKDELVKMARKSGSRSVARR